MSRGRVRHAIWETAIVDALILDSQPLPKIVLFALEPKSFGTRISKTSMRAYNLPCACRVTMRDLTRRELLIRIEYARCKPADWLCRRAASFIALADRTNKNHGRPQTVCKVAGGTLARISKVRSSSVCTGPSVRRLVGTGE